MKRVLFVDDDPNILRGLQRMLRPLRREWEMTFVESGQQALEVLRETPMDIIVSDMRMPVMDGAQLLSEVQRRYPHMVRIILSGHSDKEMILRSIGPTHRFLAKPCDAEVLRTTIAKACALRELLNDETLKQLVVGIENLPSLPSIYMEIMEELSSPDASLSRVGQIISKDVAMTAKILQIVNSAFFGLPRRIESVSQAATLLGLDTIKALALSTGAFSQFEGGDLPGFSLDELWRHSLSVGTLAQKIAKAQRQSSKLCDDALMAGLLHDCGKLILAAKLPERYASVRALSKSQGILMLKAEKDTFGTTHAELGAFLLGLWGLQDPVVEALAFHHCPGKYPGRDFTVLTAVHVANVLERELAENSSADVGGMDMTYLGALGLEGCIEGWRALGEKSQQEDEGK